MQNYTLATEKLWAPSFQIKNKIQFIMDRNLTGGLARREVQIMQEKLNYNIQIVRCHIPSEMLRKY